MKKKLKAVAAILLMTAVVFAAGCTKPEPSSGSYNGHDYVDLDLPSGTLWATCNVGATTPEGYGDYFAWGETEPKTAYDWSNYKYCHDGHYNQLTKYCNGSNAGYNGFTDNLTVLQPGDDAATANWGDGWCTPTKAQWDELWVNTTCTSTTQNDVSGRLFTASNGNTLFLPAASSDAESGTYWSGSLQTQSPISAWYFSFYSGGCAMGSIERYRGYSVRPIRSAN